jgi:hypothetical protein
MPRPRPGMGSVPGRRWVLKNGTPIRWTAASAVLREASVWYRFRAAAVDRETVLARRQ